MIGRIILRLEYGVVSLAGAEWGILGLMSRTILVNLAELPERLLLQKPRFGRLLSDVALNDDERKRLLLLSNRSEAGSRGPIAGFSLTPLPPKIARIDPDAAARWVQENNEAIKEHMQRMNTTLMPS